MPATLPDIVLEALSLPQNAIAYEVSVRLARLFPTRHVLETDSCFFQLDSFAAAGRCAVTLSPAVHAELTTDFNATKGSERKVAQAWRAVAWNGQLFEVLTLTWGVSCPEPYHFVLADREPAARAFFEAVCRFAHELRAEVLVFQSGWWQKDADLWNDIRSAGLDELVLAGDLRERIVRDFEQWLASKELYEQHGVAWKRGVLLLGPPGNGKSHCIKALVRHLGLPCLYVRSFTSKNMTDHDCIRHIFDRARHTAPCLLVLEDLDALVNDRNRSVLLNELDGFAANAGLLTVATTNHPEKLDPAILDRPSRFDRKYTFESPGPSERVRYLARWNERLRASMRMVDRELEALASVTDGFSFAYLQELLLSSMMRWISEGAEGSLAAAATREVSALRTEMAARAHEPPAPTKQPANDDDDDEVC